MPAFPLFLIAGLFFIATYDGYRISEHEKEINDLKRQVRESRESRVSGWGAYQ
jgi:hypothetical protein